MKTVMFVHVRNIATNEHFDIPQDLYDHKKKMCKTDPDFYQWESSEIAFPVEVRDDFKSISEMTSDMYNPDSYRVVADPVVLEEEIEPVVSENEPVGDRFEELKAKGWTSLSKEEKVEYKALKDKIVM